MRVQAIVRPAREDDFAELLRIHRAAFGGDTEAELVRKLLVDPSAQPVVSLVAEVEGCRVGHVLLTQAEVLSGGVHAASAMLLAPMAVLPQHQRRGVGTQLTGASLDAAASLGAGLVFVLGHRDYYPRLGFQPASRLGLAPPYPIPPKHLDSWMVAEINAGCLGSVTGTLAPAVTFRDPSLWTD